MSGESEAEAISSAYLQVIIDLIGEIKFEGEDEAEAFANAYAELVTGATARVIHDTYLIQGNQMITEAVCWF